MGDYLDIRLRPDPEFTPPLLMSALVSKLHRALVELNQNLIGVSFPGHDTARPGLGEALRVHGEKGDLEQLLGCDWLSGMHDHVAVSPLKPTPPDTAHRVVRRVQAKSSAERLRRRAMRRSGLSESQACERIPDDVERCLQLPFVSLQSRSTGQRFPLFIEHGELLAEPRPGRFNTYGLSREATIPWF